MFLVDSWLKSLSRHCQEILLVLDGNTGLNMLPQAREFNEVPYCILQMVDGFHDSISDNPNLDSNKLNGNIFRLLE